MSLHLPDAIMHCLLSQKIIQDDLSLHFGELSDTDSGSAIICPRGESPTSQ